MNMKCLVLFTELVVIPDSYKVLQTIPPSPAMVMCLNEGVKGLKTKYVCVENVLSISIKYNPNIRLIKT
jgi:hypothetical protein